MSTEMHRKYVGLPSHADIKGSHPDWLDENVKFALHTMNIEEHTKRIALLSNACFKCGEEMGSHNLRYYSKKGSCPKALRPGIYSTSYGNTARYEGGSTAFDLDSAEEIPVELLGDYIREEE